MEERFFFCWCYTMTPIGEIYYTDVSAEDCKELLEELNGYDAYLADIIPAYELLMDNWKDTYSYLLNDVELNEKLIEDSELQSFVNDLISRTSEENAIKKDEFDLHQEQWEILFTEYGFGSNVFSYDNEISFFDYYAVTCTLSELISLSIENSDCQITSE